MRDLVWRSRDKDAGDLVTVRGKLEGTYKAEDSYDQDERDVGKDLSVCSDEDQGRKGGPGSDSCCMDVGAGTGTGAGACDKGMEREKPLL